MDFSPTQAFSPDGFFLDQSETTAAIKTRSRRPCDACRRRKSRCEIAEDALPCVLCKFHRQDCTFNEEPQPRKRRAVALSEEDNTWNRDPVHRTAGSMSNGSLSGSPVDGPKIRRDAPIDDYANLRGPSLLKKTLGLQNHRHSHLIGSTSEYEQLLIELSDTRDQGDLPVGLSVLRKVSSSDTAFILSPDAGTRNHEDEVPDLDAIETLVVPHGQALIHLYFRIVHPSFPVLHKKVFLEKYQRTHREFSPPLLAAVYILALNWWSYSGELALLPKPDVPQLEKLAFKTINDIIHRPKLSTIQAGLLLLQRPEGDSWALTTQLVGLAQDLGLHLDCSSWSVPSWERGLRKRLAWALFMQDKWGALMHGRPSHITAADWNVKPLQNEDFPENAADEDDEDGSTEVEKGRTLFCEMIKLTEILGLVLSSFYTVSAEVELEQRAQEGVLWILEKAKPIQLSLRQWHSNLPKSLKMESIAMRKLSSTGYLHLGYYAVEITLHRRIIRSLSSNDDLSLRLICRQAGQARLVSAMDFVKGLRPEHLQSFWYSASKYCFALVGTFISLLWVTSLDMEEAKSYKAKLDEYRWMLRLSSKSGEFLERAIGMLASSTGVLVKSIPEQPNPELFLTRRIRNAARSASSAHIDVHTRTANRKNLTPYRTDDEAFENPPPENLVGKDSFQIELVGEDQSCEQAWFANTMSEVADVDQEAYDNNPFTQSGSLHGGYSFT